MTDHRDTMGAAPHPFTIIVEPHLETWLVLVRTTSDMTLSHRGRKITPYLHDRMTRYLAIGLRALLKICPPIDPHVTTSTLTCHPTQAVARHSSLDPTMIHIGDRGKTKEITEDHITTAIELTAPDVEVEARSNADTREPERDRRDRDRDLYRR